MQTTYSRRAIAGATIVALLLASMPSGFVSASTTLGPQFAGTGANDTSVGTRSWGTPTNVSSNDNSYATTQTLNSGNPLSNYLRASGFDFSALPSNAIIEGITVQVGKLSSGATVRDNQVNLYSSNGTTTDNKASSSDWGTTEAESVYGGASDKWGRTSWTVAEIQDSSFAVLFSAQRIANTITASVDYISVSVTYSVPVSTVTSITNAGALGTATVVGQPYTVTWEVTEGDAATPTGTVTVDADDGTSCSAAVAAGTCDITPTTPGTKSLTATYGGDSTFGGSVSGAVSHVVNKADTTTTITNTVALLVPNATSTAYAVTWLVAVTSPGAGTPTGTVTVSDGTDSCAAAVAAGTCDLTSTTGGTKNITATYGGDTNFNGSVSSGAPHVVLSAPIFTSSPVLVASSTALYTYNVTTTDANSGETFTITAPTLPSWLSFTDNADGTATLSGTPDNTNGGAHAVVLIVTDNMSLSTEQSFTVVVATAPLFDSTSYDQTVDEGSAAGFTAVAVDTDGDPLTYSLANEPAGATIGSGDGVFTWTTTEADGPGSYSFNIIASDGNGQTDTKVVTITVNELNAAPTTTDLVLTTDEDMATSTTLVGDDSLDVPANTLLFATTTNPTNGTLSSFNSSTGDFTYLPALNWSGSDSFTFEVCDNGSPSLCDSGTVNITVNALNDAPVSGNDAYSVDEDQTLTVDVASGLLDNDSDAEGDPMTIATTTNPTNGTLTLNPDGSFTYVPNSDFSGTDFFLYVANDGSVDGAVATTTITVNPVDEPAAPSSGGGVGGGQPVGSGPSAPGFQTPTPIIPQAPGEVLGAQTGTKTNTNAGTGTSGGSTNTGASSNTFTDGSTGETSDDTLSDEEGTSTEEVITSPISSDQSAATANADVAIPEWLAVLVGLLLLGGISFWVFFRRAA